jgi:hypothetical protein
MDETKKREWKTRLAGVTFEGRMERIKKYALRKSGYQLVRQPNNPHDKNAIQVTVSGHDIGFVPGMLAKELAPIMDDGTELNVHFRRALVSDKTGEVIGLIVKIWK